MQLPFTITLLFVSVTLVQSLLSDDSARLSQRDRFNEFVIDELRSLKTSQRISEERIAHLEQESHEKDMKIDELEREVHLLKESQTQGSQHLRYGRMTNRHVAFTAYLSQSINTVGHSKPIKFDRILLNDDNPYDKTTGEFTAPVSGVYLFSYSVGAKHIGSYNLTQYDVFTRLVVNGVHQLSAVSESGSVNDDEQGSSTAIIYALEGDKIWVMLENRGGRALYSEDHERVSSFTGVLLYESGSPGIVG